MIGCRGVFFPSWQVLHRLGIHGAMLKAIQSLYRDSGLTLDIDGRRGQTFQSQTDIISFMMIGYY